MVVYICSNFLVVALLAIVKSQPLSLNKPGKGQRFRRCTSRSCWRAGSKRRWRLAAPAFDRPDTSPSLQTSPFPTAVTTAEENGNNTKP